MRVISGKYKGMNIIGFDIEGTRPTQDRIKESLFAMIQNELTDSIILDLFAGSGNLGIEALSNGSTKAYFADNNHKCIEVLKKNLGRIPAEDYNIINMDYKNALKYYSDSNIKFNIIFLDPPYHLECIDNVLDSIVKLNLLEEDGIVICEYEFNKFKDSYEKLELEKTREYGYKNIRIYRKKNA